MLLACVARLVPKKGVDLLIEACATLRDRGVDVRLEVIGDGPDRLALDQACKRLGLQDRVVLRGSASQAQVADLLQRSDLFVLCCRVDPMGMADGLPNVLVEALAVGLPVVSTPVGAVQELIEDRITGVLAQSGDAASVANAVQWILEHPDDAARMAGVGRKLVEEKFDIRSDPLLEAFILYARR